MLLSSVIYVLEESLEAALLISVLMAISHQHSQRWLLPGLLGGALFSCVYAVNMSLVSQWFNYVGQEVINAILQVAISLSIILFAWSLTHSRLNLQSKPTALSFISATASVIFAMTLEGSEILIYLSSFLWQGNDQQAAALGSSIGFIIGISCGTLMYYLLRGLPASMRFYAPIFLLALFAGNMLSQSVLQLTQADWISSSQAVWDTSQALPESSLAGKLLYSLIGYEATPSLAQIIAYLLGIGLVLAVTDLRKPSKEKVGIKSQNK